VEALAQLLAVEDVRVHRLERATPLRVEVDHLVDRAHSAARKTAHDPIPVREDRAFRERLGLRHDRRASRVRETPPRRDGDFVAALDRPGCVPKLGRIGSGFGSAIPPAGKPWRAAYAAAT